MDAAFIGLPRQPWLCLASSCIFRNEVQWLTPDHDRSRLFCQAGVLNLSGELPDNSGLTNSSYRAAYSAVSTNQVAVVPLPRIGGRGGLLCSRRTTILPSEEDI